MLLLIIFIQELFCGGLHRLCKSDHDDNFIGGLPDCKVLPSVAHIVLDASLTLLYLFVVLLRLLDNALSDVT